MQAGRFRRFLPDPFVASLLTAVLVASLLPCRGIGATIFSNLTTIAIGVMFFMQGVRLSREAVIAGLTHWRLHLTILACTFALYPLLAFGFAALAPKLLPQPLWLGVTFMSLLPSTVQSSIAFVSVGKGNVAAAIVSATASNILGIFLTPLLVSLLLNSHGHMGAGQIWKILLQLLAPFIIGHLLRPWLTGWATRNKAILTISDRGSVVLAVYTAFSAAVVEGLWSKVSIWALLTVVAVNAVLLAAVLASTTLSARRLGFSKPDEIAIVFCGSKKSIASGVPMANVLFAAPVVGMAIVPLMIFHQMQMIAAAWLARRYAAERSGLGAGAEPDPESA
jgi:sodium/bile acid cotransporter 7